jgi:transposase
MDKWISDDNPVRFIDLLVEQIVSSNPDKFATKGQELIGRKAYQPATMQKLYLYGYLNSICSSRKLEKECSRNIELMWLLGKLCPDHKTISDYRKDNKEAIRFVCLSFRKFLKDQGYISGKKVAYDGSRLKANASRDTITREWVDKRLVKLDEYLNKYLDQLQKNDIADDIEEQFSQLSDNLGVETALLQKIADLQQQVEELQQHKAFMEANDLNCYAPSDPEARLMKTRDGFLPAYNMQTGVDDKNKMIVYAQVTDKGIDIDELQPDMEQTKEQLGITPSIIEADKGFANTEQIQAIEKNNPGTLCAVPLQDVKQEKIDNQAGISFQYDEKNDCVVCSEGRKLPLIARNNIKRGQHYSVYQGDCTGCPKKERCTSSKKGRMVHRNHQQEWIDSYKKRIKSQPFKTLIKERKTIVEHPFGTIKYWMGKSPLRLRGKEKVQTEIDIFTTAYNLKRILSIDNMENLIKMTQNFKWKLV